MELSLPTAFEDYSIMCLPNEILSHIFACLQAKDRKSVRLVCKLWYHSCTFSQITTKEKFVFRTQCSIEDITKVILKSHSSILNLEFQSLPVGRLPIDIWKECGSRIHFLEFYLCHWEDETIENVIVHCVNLISLTFGGIKICNFCSPHRKNIICSPELLDKIIERGIWRPKLQTFAVFIDHPSIEKIVNKIFYIYPRIRHFAARTVSSNLILNLPISLKSLESIKPHLSFTSNDEESIVMEAYIAKSKQGLRLKHFNGVFTDLQIPSKKEKLLNFFSLQKNLSSIKLQLRADFRSNNDTRNKEVFFHILKSCPSLQEYYFETFLTFKWRECPQVLSSISKLQSLHLVVRVCSDDPSISSLPSVLTLSKNLLLTTLELKLSGPYCKEQNYLCAAIFKHCPLLIHLKIDNGSDYTLSIIFEYLLKLQTLIFYYNNYDLRKKYGFTGHDASREEEFSIKRLQQLKHLSIINYTQGGLKPLTGRIIPEFQLPLLEFLELNIEFLLSLKKELINRLASQIPKLRFLSLEYYTPNSDGYRRTGKPHCKVLQFLMYLKNLYHIQINSLDGNDSSIIGEIFHACPSVKYLSNFRSVFFLDPITSKMQKEVKCKFNRSTNKPFDIFPPVFGKKIGGIYIATSN